MPIRCKSCGRSISQRSPEWVVYGERKDRSYCSQECLKAAEPHSAELWGVLVQQGLAFYRPAYKRVHDPMGSALRFL